MNNRSKLSVVSVICSLLILVGCSTQSPQSGASIGSGKNIITYDQMVAEYKKSVDNLSWPSGFTVPSVPEGEDANSSYQEGFGDTRASLTYECAWEKEWLNSYSSDEARAKTAIAALEKVPSMGYMSPERADDATRRFFNDYLERAKLGDPSGFTENVKANCPE